MRVRACPEGWDPEEATTLPTQEQSRITSYFSEDERRAHDQPTSRMLKLHRDVRVPPPATVQPPFPSPAQLIVPLHTTLWPTFRPDAMQPYTWVHPSSSNGITSKCSFRACDTVHLSEHAFKFNRAGHGETSTANTSVENLTESLRESLHNIQSTRGIGDVRDRAKDVELL